MIGWISVLNRVVQAGLHRSGATLHGNSSSIRLIG